MKRASLFLAAIIVLYFGGFIYDEVGPLFYSVSLTLIASIPLLLKYSFWKKILYMVPLLILRVVGKIFLTLFGKNALSKILQRYGLLEDRLNKVISGLEQHRDLGLLRWKQTSSASRAYLLLIFLPVGILVLIITLVIKIIRLRFLQFVIEKIMQKYFLRLSDAAKTSVSERKLAANTDKADAKPVDSVAKPEKSNLNDKAK